VEAMRTAKTAMAAMGPYPYGRHDPRFGEVGSGESRG
jgi:hypothetical protein